MNKHRHPRRASLAFAIVLVAGCGPADDSPAGDRPGVPSPTDGTDATSSNLSRALMQLASSRRRWDELKGSKGASYEYLSVDKFLGLFGVPKDYRTRLVVENDRVVRREFRFGSDQVLFTEVGAQVGTNQATYACPAVPVEGLYEGCEHLLKTHSETENHIGLSFGADGLLAECWYFPKNCADECRRGYFLTKVTFPN
jgi:hypothetical protein